MSELDVFAEYERSIGVSRQDVDKIADMAHEASISLRNVLGAARHYMVHTRGKLTYKRLDSIVENYENDSHAKIYQDMLKLFGRNGYDIAEIIIHTNRIRNHAAD